MYSERVAEEAKEEDGYSRQVGKSIRFFCWQLCDTAGYLTSQFYFNRQALVKGV